MGDNPIVYQPVSSSFITQGGHDGENTGVVEFANGKRYQIEGISAEAFQSLIDAESVGRHFNAVIKQNYSVTPVE
jgi:hypothetical protein